MRCWRGVCLDPVKKKPEFADEVAGKASWCKPSCCYLCNHTARIDCGSHKCACESKRSDIPGRNKLDSCVLCGRIWCGVWNEYNFSARRIPHLWSACGVRCRSEGLYLQCARVERLYSERDMCIKITSWSFRHIRDCDQCWQL